MQANVLVSTVGIDEAQWLGYRQQGIGGSDVAAIAGLSPWKSPMAVYLEKIGEIIPDPPGEAAYWGTTLEEVVAKEFTLRTGIKAQRRNAILQHPDYPWMLANIDRLIYDRERGWGVLECKTTSEYKREQWEDDMVPEMYLLQLQHYLAITGYTYGYLAVLIGGNKFRCIEVKRDEEMIESLIKIESDFWQMVESRTPPAADGSEACTELLKQLYPEAKVGSVVELPPEAEELIRSYESAREERLAWEKAEAKCENELKRLMGESETGLIAGRKVKWSTVVSKRFDSKRFANDYGDLYESYLVKSVSRRFSVK